MSSQPVAPTPRDPNRGCGQIVPMFACAGCKVVPLGYASFELGDGLEGMIECPARDICTWYAGHDLGRDDAYVDLPEGSRLSVAFEQTPYFWCPHFDDHAAFVARAKATRQKAERVRRSEMRKVVGEGS